MTRPAQHLRDEVGKLRTACGLADVRFSRELVGSTTFGANHQPWEARRADSTFKRGGVGLAFLIGGSTGVGCFVKGAKAP